MKTVAAISLLFLLIFSCKKTEKPLPTIQQVTEQKPEQQKTAVKYPPVYTDSLHAEDEILQLMKNRQKDILELLQQSAPKQSVSIYKNYKKENDSALILLDYKNRDLLDNFYDFYDYNEKTGVSKLKVPDSLKGKVNKITSAGIEFWDIGEGYHELRMLPDFYKKIFGNHASPDLRDYLAQTAEEGKVLFQADAGIIVSWDEIASRLLFRENFLKKYPASQLSDIIKDELEFYRSSYILGMDNTPTLYDEGGFHEIPMKSFRKFISNNPDSETAIFLKSFINLKLNFDQLNEKTQNKFLR